MILMTVFLLQQAGKIQSSKHFKLGGEKIRQNVQLLISTLLMHIGEWVINQMPLKITRSTYL